MTDRLSLTQKRMRFLHEELKDLTNGRELKTKLLGLPVALRLNGLAVILARFAAAADYKEKVIGSILAHWLLREHPLTSGTGKKEIQKSQANVAQLLYRCLNSSRIEYEALQHEAMALLEQAKLISEALWPGED